MECKSLSDQYAAQVTALISLKDEVILKDCFRKCYISKMHFHSWLFSRKCNGQGANTLVRQFFSELLAFMQVQNLRNNEQELILMLEMFERESTEKPRYVL